MRKVKEIIDEIERKGETEIPLNEISNEQIMELYFKGIAIEIDGDKGVAVLFKKAERSNFEFL